VCEGRRREAPTIAIAALRQRSYDRPTRKFAFWDVFRRASLGDHKLLAASQAGLVNNLNFGMSWGRFALFYASFGLVVERISILNSVYPAVWGVLQTLTGPAERLLGPQGLDRDRNVGAR
jgi:hypothetical protein